MTEDLDQDERAAIEELLRALAPEIARYPDRPDILHKAALCHLLLGDPAPAWRDLVRATEINPRYLDALRALAFAELAAGDAPAGAACVARLEAAVEPGWKVPLAAGLFFAAAGRFGDARAALEKAVAAAPGRPLPAYALAHVEDELAPGSGTARREEADGRFPALAGAARDRRILGNPGRALVFREAARRGKRAGEGTRALGHLERALGLDLDLALDAAARAEFALAEGDAPAAIDGYRRAIAIDPELTAARIALSAALSGIGDLSGAAAELEAAASLHPEYPDLHQKLGALYLDQADYSRAATEFEAAIARNRRFAASHYLLGCTRFAGGDFRGALDAYALALENGCDNDELPVHKGFAHLRLGEREEARRSFEDAIVRDESAPLPHLGLALVAESRGHLDAAAAHLADYDAREHNLSADADAIALRKRLGAGEARTG